MWPRSYLRCLHYLGYHPLVLSRSWLDYTDPNELEFCLKVYQPDVVINCAGYTGETVDDCQTRVRECGDSNMVLPGNIAEICQTLRVPLIHISSGCIFHGDGPFREDFDEEGDLGWLNFCDNAYQRTKLFGEQRVAISCDRHWIFRIRMPFSHIPHRRNWLTKLKQYDLILDGLNSVTWIDEFAMRSWQLWQKAPPGIYHAAQKTPVWTLNVARMMRPEVKEYDPVRFLKHHVQRSAAVLDCSKFEKAYGTEFTDSMVALRWCIRQMEADTATTGRSTFAVDNSPERTMSAGASARIG